MPPILLSFFCAGLPSQNATTKVVRLLGGNPEEVTSLRYRGEGWPGRFAISQPGLDASLSYSESWGTHLGPTMQWRCKACADGVGESADIVAADFWEADACGYPKFDEGDGVSAVLTRTPAGAALFAEAMAAGVIEATEISVSALYGIQPHQRERRSTMAARLLGVRLGLGTVPRYKGFGLWRHASTSALPDLPRALVGGFRRYRQLMNRPLEER